MPIDEKNLIRHELIGLDAQVGSSRDLSKKGVCGKIIDETQKTITIRTDKKETIIAKKECKFMIKIPSGETVEVDGSLLYGRPEERIKKKLPKKWCVI